MPEAFHPQMDYGGLEKIAPELRDEYSNAIDKQDVKPESDDQRWYAIDIDPGRGKQNRPKEDVRVVHGPATLEKANLACNRGHPDTHRVVSDTVLRLGEQSEKVTVKRTF